MKKRDKTHGGIKVSEKSGRERSRPHNALSSNKSLDKKTKQNGFNQWISNLDKATELCLQLETRWHSRSFNGIILDQDKNRLIVICKLLANGYQELLKHGKNISDENKIVLNFLVRIITTLEEINKHQTTTKILENLPLLINHLKELSPIKIPSPFENSYKLKSIIQALNSLNRELEPHSIIFYFRTDIQYSSLDQAIFNELFYLRNRFKEKIQNLIEHSIQTGSIQRSFERYAAQMLMLYKNINAYSEKLAHLINENDSLTKKHVSYNFDVFYKYLDSIEERSILPYPSVYETFNWLINKLSKFGIQNVFYGVCVEVVLEQKRIWGYYGNHDTELMDKYFDENRLNHDPTLKAFFNSNDLSPVLWNYPEDIERNAGLSNSELEVEHIAWKDGLINGVSIPLRLDSTSTRPLAAASVCVPAKMPRDEWSKLWEKHQDKIIELLNQFHDQVMDIPNFVEQLTIKKDYRPLFDKMFGVVELDTIKHSLNNTLEAVTFDLDETPPDKRMARLNEIYESARAHLRETIGEEALTETKEVTKPDIILPTDHEKYKDRADTSETAIKFLGRVWGDLLDEKRVYQFNLSKIDPTLVSAVKYEAKNKDGKLSDHIPPKRVYIDLEVAVEKAADEFIETITGRKPGQKLPQREIARKFGNKKRRQS